MKGVGVHCQRRGGGEWVIDGEEEGCRERLNGLEMEGADWTDMGEGLVEM